MSLRTLLDRGRGGSQWWVSTFIAADVPVLLCLVSRVNDVTLSELFSSYPDHHSFDSHNLDLVFAALARVCILTTAYAICRTLSAVPLSVCTGLSLVYLALKAGLIFDHIDDTVGGRGNYAVVLVQLLFVLAECIIMNRELAHRRCADFETEQAMAESRGGLLGGHIILPSSEQSLLHDDSGSGTQTPESAAKTNLVMGAVQLDTPNLSGVWAHTHDDQAPMDALLESEGIGWAKRRLFRMVHPVLTINQVGEVFRVHLKGATGTVEDNYSVGDRFEQVDAATDKTNTFCTGWERSTGKPTKLHQYNVSTPTRGLRRWLQQQGNEVVLVQELENEKGCRAKRFFRKQKNWSPTPQQP